MKNTRLNISCQHNRDNPIAKYTKTKQELVSLELQSITSANPGLKDGDDGEHKDKTLINNLPGNLSGNGNGSIFISIYNHNYSMQYPPTTYEIPVHSYYPPLRPPSAFGNKRAVLFGISYANTATAKKLKGSVNNARCMKHFLIDKLGFPGNSICMLTDDSEEKNTIPSKSNMRMAMRWLVEGCKPGDSLVFYFCGHASRVKDRNVDEVDGYDEAICPVDYEQEGMILDDEINATIVRPLPHGAKLHALVDASFSGTILDIPFVCKMNRIASFGWKDHRHRRAGNKGTRGGLAVCISACDDSDGKAGRKSVCNVPKLTYGRLLNDMLFTIQWAKAGKLELKGQDFARNTWKQNTHEPQLSSTEKFDISTKLFQI
ncbi:metacaspase-1 isoform X3 [Medicago truncatula]|uniref:ICE-like protease (Caspase) p20 domain protein n=1 Tax=Medicago truncatula TaxID=3880 RepID=A0A072V469_MEDTR|nr:metacaspase-1 isoform X3 [Medicago truncatula]KEH36446.1 ICE-like protease (caspase) p20 domain protein [Medicago truncatula]